MKNRITIYDIELAPNKAMVGFKDHVTGEIRQFDHSEGQSIAKYIKNRILVGFNSLNYDNIILTGMLRGKSMKWLYETSVDLIEGGGKRWNYPSDINNGIDLMEVVQGQASLKLYGARLNTKKLQDLPYDPHRKHSKKMWKNVCKYNKNDLQLTEELYNFILPQLKLRKDIGDQYGINVMSRSDAQTAEDIFKIELAKKGIDVKLAKKNLVSISNIRYKAPKSVKYDQKLVKRIEAEHIQLTKGGSPIIPKWLKDLHITINKGVYNFGLGGLHSMEKSTAVIPPKGYTLGNVDIASMYPSLIINMGLFPKHLSSEFLKIYSKIRDVRLKAKAAGDKVVADTLKIVLNGSYGKFGSKYSFLYAPDMMLQVTFTGQLYLLGLIEKLEDAGVRVVSANTDGLELVYKSVNTVVKVVDKWEKETNMLMEYGEYNTLYSRDVNSYIAIYDGYAKSKGFYSEPKIDKNNEYQIVIEAIREFLLNGKSMKKTIKACKDIEKFCVSRQVTGGAVWSSENYPDSEEYTEYLKRVPFKQNKALEKRNDNFKKEFVLAEAEKNYIGKVVRFYFAKDGKPMFYKKSGNRVPKSDSCVPMMELTKKLPKDINYKKYFELAETHLAELGYEKS